MARVALLLALIVVAPAFGQSRIPPAGEVGGMKAPPPDEVNEVAVFQNLGDDLPLDVPFFDEAGRPVQLGDYFTGDKPVLLEFVYFDCPMSCPLVTSGIAEAANATGWTPGEDFTIVSISVNPRDTPVAAAKKKAEALAKLDAPAGITGKGWHFLTGRESDIKAAAAAAGFGYSFVPRTNDYAHGEVIIFATPTGTISRYLLGHRYEPLDFRLALAEAGEGKQGSIFDAILQTCYHWDPQAGQYTVQAMQLMKFAGAVTVLTLGGIIAYLLYLERRRRRRDADEDHGGGPTPYPDHAQPRTH